jgi:hypothetical protein
MSDDKEQELSQVNDSAIVIQEKKAETENKSVSALIEVFVENSLKLSKISEEEKTKLMAEKRNAVEGFIKSLGTPDVLKTMLATQMLDTYEHQQRITKQVRLSAHPPHQQSLINTAAKLSNVFIQQVGLMQKLNGQGQQKVVVEHVHVHSGGQAIVGNVEKDTQGGRG